jgi:hypothetical protein
MPGAHVHEVVTKQLLTMDRSCRRFAFETVVEGVRGNKIAEWNCQGEKIVCRAVMKDDGRASLAV